jgi:hypothetical protein
VDDAALQSLQLWLLWADLAGLGVLGALAWRAHPPGLLLREWLALALVFGVALVLRLFCSPWAVIHENAHGYEFIRTAFTLVGSFYYGAGFAAFHHPLSLIFGPHPGVLFAAKAVLGALSSVLLVFLGVRLLGGWPAGVLAGLAYACWPTAVRIGGSECFFPLAVFFGLTAWWGWLLAWRWGQPILFLLAAGAAAFAVQVRPEMALWPLLLLLSLPLCPGWTRWLRSGWSWAALAVFLALTAPWIVVRAGWMRLEGLPGFLRLDPLSFAAALVSRGNLVLDRAWAPEAAWVLGGLGLMVLPLGRPRAAPALLLGALLLAWPVLGVQSGQASAVRLQSLFTVPVLLLIGLGAGWLVGRFREQYRWLALLVIGAALLFNSTFKLPRAALAEEPQLEYRFLQRELPALPARCTIVTADRFMAGRVISTELPVWWLGERNWLELGAFLQAGTPDPGRECVVFYQGLSCFEFLDHELERLPPTRIRTECQRILPRFSLRPLAEERLPNRPDEGFLHLPSPTVTLGFYRLEPIGEAEKR